MIETDHRREVEFYIQSLVEIETIPRANEPTTHRVSLRVGVERFRVGGVCESRDQAEWLRRRVVQSLTSAFIEAPHEE
jgi:hypothetical protein